MPRRGRSHSPGRQVHFAVRLEAPCGDSPAERALLEQLQGEASYRTVMTYIMLQTGLAQDDLQTALLPLCQLCWSIAGRDVTEAGGLVHSLQSKVESLRKELLQSNVSSMKEITRLKHCEVSIRDLDELDKVTYHEPLAHLDEETRELCLRIIVDRERQILAEMERQRRGDASAPPTITSGGQEEDDWQAPAQLEEQQKASDATSQKLQLQDEELCRLREDLQDLRSKLRQAEGAEAERQQERDAELQKSRDLQEQLQAELQRLRSHHAAELETTQREMQRIRSQFAEAQTKVAEAERRRAGATTVACQTQMTGKKLEHLEAELQKSQELRNQLKARLLSLTRAAGGECGKEPEVSAANMKGVFERLWEDALGRPSRREQLQARRHAGDAEEDADEDGKTRWQDVAAMGATAAAFVLHLFQDSPLAEELLESRLVQPRSRRPVLEPETEPKEQVPAVEESRSRGRREQQPSLAKELLSSGLVGVLRPEANSREAAFAAPTRSRKRAIVVDENAEVVARESAEAGGDEHLQKQLSSVCDFLRQKRAVHSDRGSADELAAADSAPLPPRSRERGGGAGPVRSASLPALRRESNLAVMAAVAVANSRSFDFNARFNLNGGHLT